MKKSELENMNRDKWNLNDFDKYRLNKWTKGGFSSLIGGAIIALAAGWLFLIPAAAAFFLIYLFIVYARDRNSRRILYK